MSTLIYNPELDNPSYKDVIEENVVLNEKGEVKIVSLNVLPKSVQDVTFVLSGKGLYRAWLSNLQKSIRRGKVEDAIYSANQCIQFKGLFLSHIVNRVCKVIVSEDIGIANNKVVFECLHLIKQFEEEKKNNNSDNFYIEFRNKLFTVIVKLCEGNKSRITDHALHFTKRCLYEKTIHNNFNSFDSAFQSLKKNILILKNFKCLNQNEDCYNLISTCVNDIFNLVKFGSEKCQSEFEKNKINLLPFCKPSKFSKKIYLLWDRILCNTEYIKLFLSSVAEEESITNEENEEKFSIKINRLKMVNQCLYIIWYMHSGDENILNILHAFFNIIFGSKIIDDLENKNNEDIEKEETRIKNMNFDEMIANDSIQIMSASYDKHVRRWKSEERNSVKFFLRYGVKLDKLHPNLKNIDEDLYHKLY